MKKLFLIPILFLLMVSLAFAASPVINEVSISPFIAYTNNSLTGFCNASAADGDGFVYDYKWFKNGGLFDYSLTSSFFSYEDESVGYQFYDVFSDDKFVFASGVSGLSAFSYDGINLTEEDTVLGLGTSVWVNSSYVFNTMDDNLSVYSFNGSDLLFIDSIYAGHFVDDIWGDGNYIYVDNGYDNSSSVGGLRAFSFNGSDLTLVGSSDVFVDYLNIWGDGNYIYGSGGSTGVYVFSFNGSNFTTIVQLNSFEDCLDVWGDGNYIYVSEGTGLRAYSFNGSDFVDVGYKSRIEDGYFFNVWGDGNYIYSANFREGLSVYSFNGSDFVENINFLNYSSSPASYRVWANTSDVFFVDFYNDLYVYSVDALYNVSSNVSVVDSSSVFSGDSWLLSCSAVCSDFSSSSWLNSSSLVISNSLPVVLTSNISPSSSLSNGSLTGSCTGSDVDGDSLSSVYDWFSGGVSTGVTSSVLSSDYLVRGDGVVLSCNVFDGSDNGSTWINSTSVTISNTPTVINSVTVVTSTGGLNCSYDFFDEDNDTVVAEYFNWSVNDVGVVGVDNVFLSSANFSDFDNVTCSIIVYDGYENSTIKNSSIFNPSDVSAPVISDFVIPSTGTNIENVIITVNCTDDISIGSGYPKISYKFQDNTTYEDIIMTSFTTNIYRFPNNFGAVGVYSGFNVTCVDGSGNSAFSSSNSTLTISTPIVPVTSGGGGSTTIVIGDKIDCNITFQPNTLVISRSDKIYEVKVRNDDTFTYSTDIGFGVSSGNIQVSSTSSPGGLKVSNTLLSLLPGKVGSFGVSYEGSSDLLLSGEAVMTLSSSVCNDVYILVIVDSEAVTSLFDLLFAGGSFKDFVLQPVLSENSVLERYVGFVNVLWVFALSLIFSFLLFATFISDNFKEKNYGLLVAIVLFAVVIIAPIISVIVIYLLRLG